MNKQKIKNRQQSSKNKKIRKKEQEDQEGIRRRRKGDKPEMDIEVFYVIKACLIIGIIVSYFFFSTLLLPLFIAFTSLFYFSFWVERKINRSYNVENKKSIFKMDAALAFITILVGVTSTIFTFSRIAGSKFSSLSFYINRIMSLSTGVRNKQGSSFGGGGKPEGFVKPEGGTRPNYGNGQRPQRPNFDLNDLPVEYAFNQILSSIVQFLIFSVIIISSITVFIYFYNKFVKSKRLKIKQNEKNDWSFSKDDLINLLEEKI